MALEVRKRLCIVLLDTVPFPSFVSSPPNFQQAFTFSAVAAFLETAAAHCSVGLVDLEAHPALVNK
ncbi:hypothetical protein QJS10_CPB17g01449 [Acorus calamus]|uniref:Uncharacterized protein n=1 Tax=Acorus calamus TaxID=4465 RepID=A0AAV9CWG6_ACOCL|nr:hypothetical protein QJS10_CPB17g01449 [Acorus calamus]